jgi:CDP-glucose 4,6-dehydratase
MSEHIFWKDRNVFVTGCTGFLGSWLVDELIARGATVVGLIRDWVPNSLLVCSRNVEKIVVVRGQIEDFSVLRRAINEHEINTVFHLAAQTIVGTAARGPIDTFEVNIRGTWNLLEACRQSKAVERVVVASSDKAYGEQAVLPYIEEAPMLGSFPYDVSKSCADLICRSYWRTFGLPVSVTRCANFYGGGDLNYNRLIPGTIRSVLKGERPIVRSSGAPRRDYLYIEDAVNAYLTLAEKIDSPEVMGQAFNFGNDRPIGVLDVVDQILEATGDRHLKPVVLDEARSEIMDQWLCSNLAKEVLGWRPSFSLEDGLKKTVEHYREILLSDR